MELSSLECSLDLGAGNVGKVIEGWRKPDSSGILRKEGSGDMSLGISAGGKENSPTSTELGGTPTVSTVGHI